MPEEEEYEEEQYCDFCDLLPGISYDAYSFYVNHYNRWIEGWLIEMFNQEILTDVSAQYLYIDEIFMDVLYDTLTESWEIHGN